MTKIIVFLYYITELYHTIIITHLLLSQLPGIDFGKWPLSIIRLVTVPYLVFWKNILPRTIIRQSRFIIPMEYLTYFLALQTLNPMLKNILIYYENYFYLFSTRYYLM